MERIVKRSEVVSDEDISMSSPEPNTLQRIQVADEFHFVERRASLEKQAETNLAEDDDELEFRLFAPSGPASGPQGSSQAVAKIRLQSPEPGNSSPGFLIAQRKQSYYFSQSPSPDTRRALQYSAVTGRDVIARSKSFCPGMAYDWKVIRLPATRKQRAILSGSDATYRKLLGESEPSKHKRKGKMARLKIRKKIAEKKVKAEEEKQAAEIREAMDREKRTRRNREKKVKKKMREQAKKQKAADGVSEMSEEP